MNLKIISLESFKKDAKKLYKKNKKLPIDLKKLNDILEENPKSGIELSSDLYKIRLENSSSKVGKSGGFRVIYYYIDKNEKLYLLKIVIDWFKLLITFLVKENIFWLLQLLIYFFKSRRYERYIGSGL